MDTNLGLKLNTAAEVGIPTSTSLAGFATSDVGEFRLHWRRVRGHWVLPDRQVAQLLRLPARELNRRVLRHPAEFPPDFAFRVTLAEWERYWPYLDGGSRRTGARAPMVYSPAGLLQQRWMSGGDEGAEVVRWLAQLAAVVHAPAPESLVPLLLPAFVPRSLAPRGRPAPRDGFASGCRHPAIELSRAAARAEAVYGAEQAV